MSGSRITGWGAHLPEKVLTNHQLSEMMDTNHDWIVERTGISRRHIGGSTGEMASLAGAQALETAGRTGEDIDLVIVATSTPDQLMPGTSARVHDELEIRGGACDLQAVCSGFTYGLTAANGLISSGGLERVLVIGSDALSDYINWEDRSTAILFGDGAGAVVLERHHEPTLLSFDLGAEGKSRHIGYTDHGGHITMDGKEVFRQAVRAVTISARRAMERANVTVDDIDWFVPHQANIRIIEGIANRLKIPMDRAIVTIGEHANNSAATIPIALDTAITDGRIKPGDLLLLGGFGFGMTWASAVLRWTPNE
jgi:3-oxoacyl-[acyl-carrier-protein] synthase-3